jgi:hypothetical protein
MSKPRGGGLTAKEIRFVEALDACGNQAEAARRAGYQGPRVRKIASEMLGKPHIQAALADLRKDAAELAKVRVARILEEQNDIALADVTGAFDVGGQIKPMKEWPEALRRALKSFKVRELFNGDGDTAIGLLTEVSFQDKQKAAEILLRAAGALESKSDGSDKAAGGKSIQLKYSTKDAERSGGKAA